MKMKSKIFHAFLAIVILCGTTFSVPGLTVNAQCKQNKTIITTGVSQKKVSAIKPQSKLPKQKLMGNLPYPDNELFVDAISIFPAYVADNKTYFDDEIHQDWNFYNKGQERDITITKAIKEKLFNQFKNSHQTNPTGWYFEVYFTVEAARPVSMSWKINGQQYDAFPVYDASRYYTHFYTPQDENYMWGDFEYIGYNGVRASELEIVSVTYDKGA